MLVFLGLKDFFYLQLPTKRSPATKRIAEFCENRMTDVLLSPDPNTTSSVFQNNSSNHSTPNSSKKRLNWLSWMRKSLHIGGNRNQQSHHSQHRNSNKLCACGLHHVLDQNHDAETKSADYSSADDWPVFTTQMSQSGKSRSTYNFCLFLTIKFSGSIF